MPDKRIVNLIRYVGKAFLLVVLIYAWIWGGWTVHNFVDVVATAIGILALVLL